MDKSCARKCCEIKLLALKLDNVSLYVITTVCVRKFINIIPVILMDITAMLMQSFYLIMLNLMDLKNASPKLAFATTVHSIAFLIEIFSSGFWLMISLCCMLFRFLGL